MKLTIDGFQNKKQNKYYFWYKKIIFSQLQNPPKYYIETHHILPRSLGGTDNPENLVKVSLKAHYVLHKLLTKFLLGNAKYKMIFALTVMQGSKKYNFSSRDYYFSNKLNSQASKQRSLNYWNSHRSTTYRNDLRKGLYTKLNQKHVHEKCMKTREEQGTNVFVTDNPMKKESCLRKKVLKTSGPNHYSKEKKYFYKFENDENWTLIDFYTSTLCFEIEKLNVSIRTFYNYLNTGKPVKRGSGKGLMFRSDNES